MDTPPKVIKNPVSGRVSFAPVADSAPQPAVASISPRQTAEAASPPVNRDKSFSIGYKRLKSQTICAATQKKAINPPATVTEVTAPKKLLYNTFLSAGARRYCVICFFREIMFLRGNSIG